MAVLQPRNRRLCQEVNAISLGDGRRRFGRGAVVLAALLLLAGCGQDPRCSMLAEAFDRQTERVHALSDYIDAAGFSARWSARQSVIDSILVARGLEAGDLGAWLDLSLADTAGTLVPIVDLAPEDVLHFLQADTVEALLLDLGLAMSVLDAMTVLEDAGVQCPEHVCCTVFRQGVEATAEMWRLWEDLAISQDGDSITVSEPEGPALAIREAAQGLAKLTERARPQAEAAGCACLPWSEAVAVWAKGGDRGPPDFDLELYSLATSLAGTAADACWCEAWGPVGDGTLPIWLPTWLRVPKLYTPELNSWEWECAWPFFGGVLAFFAVLAAWGAVGLVAEARRPDLVRRWTWLWVGVGIALGVGLIFIVGVNLTGSAGGGFGTVIALLVGGIAYAWLTDDSRDGDPPEEPESA